MWPEKKDETITNPRLVPRARDRQMVTVPCPRKEREPEPRAASDLACRSQAARCKEMPFFSAAERSGEVPRLSQGIHGKVAAGPACALMGSLTGAWVVSHGDGDGDGAAAAAASSASGHRFGWVMKLIAAAGRCGKKSERRPDESFRRSTRGQVWRIAPKSCGLWSGVECPRWSTLLSVVDSFGGQGRVGQRPPTVTCCQFVHRVYARQNCFFFLPPLSVCLSACSLNSPLHKLSFWPAQPN